MTILMDSRVPEQQALAEAIQVHLNQGTEPGFISSIVDVQSLATSTDVKLAERCISLLDVSRPFLFHLEEPEFLALKQLVSSTSEILWVSQGTSSPTPPEFSMIDGFARVMRSEYPLLKFTSLAMEHDPTGNLDGSHCISQVWHRMLRTSHAETEHEYRQRDGLLEIPRVIHSVAMNSMIAARGKERQMVEKYRLGDAPPLGLHIGSIGSLNSVCFSETSQDQIGSAPLTCDDVLVRVWALGFDRRDFLIASGRLNDDGLGVQWSGSVVKSGPTAHFQPGDRVCGVSPKGLQILVRCPSTAFVLVPPSLSQTSASLLPIASIIGLHAMTELGGLDEGNLVLVHNAASTVGQVVVQIAQSMGANVFVTAKTRVQREMLARVYTIPPDQIFSTGSRRILHKTHGQKMDVLVAISPDQEEIDGLWDCVTAWGRIVHVCDDGTTGSLGHQTPGNVTYAQINPARFVRESRACVSKLWARAAALLRDGTIYPVTGSEVYSASDVGSALEFFASGEELGGSVVDLTDENLVKVSFLFINHSSAMNKVTLYTRLTTKYSGTPNHQAPAQLRFRKHLCHIGRAGWHRSQHCSLDGCKRCSSSAVTFSFRDIEARGSGTSG